MAYERIKTEMKSDPSRWGHREDIKRAADRLRREADKRACDEGERDTCADPSKAEMRALGPCPTSSRTPTAP